MTLSDHHHHYITFLCISQLFLCKNQPVLRRYLWEFCTYNSQ